MRFLVLFAGSVLLTAQTFPDARRVPTGWTGPAFKLSQAYPANLPAGEPKPWKSFDFRTQPAQYANAVRDYCFEGNIPIEFRVQDNPVRKWYHAPFMHRNREFLRGLTQERASRPRELHPNQTTQFENWGIGFYNPTGGHILGRVWQNPDLPNPNAARFPDGAVAFKLLFTAATVAEVPFLAGSVEWDADIDRDSGTGPRPKLRLLQMDIAVRDTRANSTTGWVFGTYIYNGNAPGATPWDRMVPVGLMWGNDPTKLGTTAPLTQTWINPDVLAGATPLVQHLGYEKRLNGPVDNPRSSCLSCHSTAGVPESLTRGSVPQIPPANASQADLRRYFRNLKAGTRFASGFLSLDYSLQLQMGILASLPAPSRE